MVQRMVENGGLRNGNEMLEGGPGFLQADHPWRELHLCLLYAPFRRARCVRFPPTWINSSRKGPRACWFPRKYGIHKFVQHSVATNRNRETTYWRRLLERLRRAGLHQVLTTLFDLFALALEKRQCSRNTCCFAQLAFSTNQHFLPGRKKIASSH